MWNHRDLNDQTQAKIEEIIKDEVPNYQYGTRREDPTNEIQKSGRFESVLHVEQRFEVDMARDDVIEAWRSHATLARQAGGRFPGVIDRLEDSAAIAAQVGDSGGVWVMPALQGLGTPYMEPGARAVFGGISRGTTRAHIVRAVLEGIAFRTREVFETILEDASIQRPERLRVDGGAAANDFLLQQLADIAGIAVERPKCVQASALGAAYLAGLAAGVWQSIDEVRESWRSGGIFEPRIGRDEADQRFSTWRQAIAAVRGVPS